MIKPHCFNPAIAAVVGVNSAIILFNIEHWAEKNKANKKHLHEGRYWTYNSMAAFAELYPYMTARQVKTAIEKLLDAGLIVKGRFNAKGYDKTNWYSPEYRMITHLTLKSYHETSESNGLDTEVQPIPINKPDLNTNNTLSIKIDEVAAIYSQTFTKERGFRQPKALTDKRKKAFNARLKDYPKAQDIEWWKSFFTQAIQSKFLNGQIKNDRNWKPDFDFFISPNGFMGVVEGKYE